MDFLKSQFDRIQQQINGLNASQKMLTASLVAVMVLTLMFWGRYAGQSEMEPMLNQSFTDDELQRVLSILDTKGIEHRVSSDKRVLVPAESRIAALAYLGYNSVLPKSTVNGFDDVIKQLTPWDGQDKQGQVFNHGKELALERVIGEFPGVAGAKVFIDARSQRIIGRDIEPTATVNIQMRDGAKPGKQLVNAAANIVVGAQAGSALNHVKVIVDGALYAVHAPNAEDGPGDDLALERLLLAEKHLTDKLQNHLSYIEGVRVSVTVHVNNASAVSDSTVYDKNKTVKEDQETSSKIREETGGFAAPAGEGGAGPNISLSVSGAGSGGGRTSTETTETVKNFIAPSVERRTTKTPAGEWAPVGASVRVPRSYFVNVAKYYSADGKAPDAAAVNKAAEEEMAKIRKDVLACTGLKDVGEVSVETYSDVAPVPAAPIAVATASSVSLAIGGHTKEIVLGALALVSLFMMSMIVKKGPPAPVPVPAAHTAPAPRGPSPLLERGEMLAGDVAEASPLLDGMELDDDAVKTQQMLVQVSSMVGENPDAAANLVKRWLNRT